MDGTVTHPYQISNYRQLALMKIYSWASFELIGNIIVPPLSLTVTYIEPYYGEAFTDGGYNVSSSNIPQATGLFSDCIIEDIVIKKRVLIMVA
jgi:hypothetical protein